MSTKFNSLGDTFVGTRFQICDENTSSEPISWVPERSRCGCHNDEQPMKRTSRGPFHFRPFSPIFTKRQDGNRTPNLLPERPRSMQRLNPLNSLLQLLTERTLRDNRAKVPADYVIARIYKHLSEVPSSSTSHSICTRI